jgi:hypothetical protein
MQRTLIYKALRELKLLFGTSIRAIWTELQLIELKDHIELVTVDCKIQGQ